MEKGAKKLPGKDSNLERETKILVYHYTYTTGGAFWRTIAFFASIGQVTLRILPTAFRLEVPRR